MSQAQCRTEERAEAQFWRCGIYTRTAAPGGLELAPSIEAQREICARYVAGQPGWRVAPQRYDDDGCSGANLNRPALQRLLVDIAMKELDVVVVERGDRVSRWYLDFLDVLQWLADEGVTFVAVTEHVSTQEAEGAGAIRLLRSFADLQRAASPPLALAGRWRS